MLAKVKYKSRYNNNNNEFNMQYPLEKVCTVLYLIDLFSDDEQSGACRGDSFLVMNF